MGVVISRKPRSVIRLRSSATTWQRSAMLAVTAGFRRKTSIVGPLISHHLEGAEAHIGPFGIFKLPPLPFMGAIVRCENKLC